ncbi:MAG: substrate-binding domain-containing protein [Pseudomonadota bacterium]
MSDRNAGGGLGKLMPVVILLAVVGVFFANLFGGSDDGAPGPADPSGAADLVIVSGSENKALEPIVEAWARDQGRRVEMRYQGSVDISRALDDGAAAPFDAVWPAHSLWIELGDRQRVVKHAESILRSPVVLALKRGIARDLGWIGRRDLSIQEIQEAAGRGAFRLAMTSATQSNSGASAYFGFLYAMAGDPDVLTLETLERPDVREGVRALLRSVDRSSGSSGWLKDAFVENPDRFDAMMNYEALAIEANQAFVAAGREPLQIIYPANGLAVADSPLGYVDKGDADKEELFLALQAHLLSSAVQDQLVALGRRAGLLGLDVARADRAVWNPDWGVDLERDIAPIPTPKQEVIRRALTLYQTDLRKPSLTVWVLDVSGSMDGDPIDQLKSAMRLLLDDQEAARNLLQPSPRDVTAVVVFNNRVVDVQVVEGDAQADLDQLMARINALEAGGGTDLYGALIAALNQLAVYDRRGDLFERLPAIVAMTDGDSDTANAEAFRQALRSAPFGRDVPIHAVAFGQANESQLTELTSLTVGRLFRAKSGGDGLAKALRAAKGYN